MNLTGRCVRDDIIIASYAYMYALCTHTPRTHTPHTHTTMHTYTCTHHTMHTHTYVCRPPHVVGVIGTSQLYRVQGTMFAFTPNVSAAVIREGRRGGGGRRRKR